MSEKFLNLVREIEQMSIDGIFKKFNYIENEEVICSEEFKYRKYKFKLEIIINIFDKNRCRIKSIDCEDTETYLWCVFDRHSFFPQYVKVSEDEYNYLIECIHENIDMFFDNALPAIISSIKDLEKSKMFFESKINEINNR